MGKRVGGVGMGGARCLVRGSLRDPTDKGRKVWFPMNPGPLDS